MNPRPQTAAIVAEVLGAKLGRQLSPSDLGFAGAMEISADVGLLYPDDPTESVKALAILWSADSDSARVISDAGINLAAWSDASLSWLLREETHLVAGPNSGRRIGAADITAIRATTEAFSSLDNSFGGGHARRALIRYLQTDVTDMLKGQYSESTGRSLFDAVAEATLLAAWMSYDAGKHGLAQRYFIQALRLAHTAENSLLAGSILDAMSHQATFLGRGREAANLARAARNGTRGIATSTLTAHFYAMEARALAIADESVGAQRALSEAVRIFEKRQPGNDPDWISYFNDIELSAEFSHCFRDLRRSSDAITYAERGISGTSPRSDFFVTMVLAAGHLGGDQRGDVDQACEAVKSALLLGRQVQSARCVEYLRQFRAALAPLATHRAVLALSEEMREHPLWKAAG
jgi:tetratricopeptide (TPR) repeat protein